VVVSWFELRITAVVEEIVAMVEEFEVLQMLEQSNEVYDLPAGPFGRSQGKGADGWEEVFKVSSNPRHKTMDVQEFYLEVLDVG
jgi:hypothetical protein